MAAPKPGLAGFSERLREARLSKGYRSLRSFAAALGVNENSYGRYERGEAAPRQDVLRMICEKLHVSPTDLYGWSSEAARISNPLESPGAAVPSALDEAESGFREDPAGYAAAVPARTKVRADRAAWELASALIDLSRKGSARALSPGARLRSTVELSNELVRDPLPAIAKALRSVSFDASQQEQEALLADQIASFLNILESQT